MISQYCQISLNIWHFALELSARLDASGAAEADRDLVAVNDHRYRAAPVAVHEHARESCSVLLDVEVLERNLPPLKVVTGGLRVRSGVFAEDENHVSILLRVRSGSDRGQIQIWPCW
jgi:hypothetical protein